LRASPFAETGGDHRDPHIFLWTRVNDRAKVDAGVRIHSGLDRFGGFGHLGERQIGTARHVQQHAPRALD
jgi:hypothetical protein